MTKHIALLRAVNVGGTRMVSSADLKTFFGVLGFVGAATLLNSGNVVFGSAARKGTALEKYLGAEARKRLGLDTDFIVRDARTWRELIDANPFPREAKKDPARLYVIALTGPVERNAVKALELANPGRERIVWGGSHLYAFYPDGAGNSKLSTQLMFRHLGVRVTGRNWNTVLKLLALVEA
jgi:uncharacterized protein (DUF1697 family)